MAAAAWVAARAKAAARVATIGGEGGCEGGRKGGSKHDSRCQGRGLGKRGIAQESRHGLLHCRRENHGELFDLARPQSCPHLCTTGIFCVEQQRVADLLGQHAWRAVLLKRRLRVPSTLSSGGAVRTVGQDRRIAGSWLERCSCACGAHRCGWGLDAVRDQPRRRVMRKSLHAASDGSDGARAHVDPRRREAHVGEALGGVEGAFWVAKNLRAQRVGLHRSVCGDEFVVPSSIRPSSASISGRWRRQRSSHHSISPGNGGRRRVSLLRGTLLRMSAQQLEHGRAVSTLLQVTPFPTPEPCR